MEILADNSLGNEKIIISRTLVKMLLSLLGNHRNAIIDWRYVVH